MISLNTPIVRDDFRRVGDNRTYQQYFTACEIKARQSVTKNPGNGDINISIAWGSWCRHPIREIRSSRVRLINLLTVSIALRMRHRIKVCCDRIVKMVCRTFRKQVSSYCDFTKKPEGPRAPFRGHICCREAGSAVREANESFKISDDMPGRQEGTPVGEDHTRYIMSLPDILMGKPI
jgi:hypothetical protein